MPGLVADGPALGHAANAFLAGVTNPNPATADGIALRALVDEFGTDTPDRRARQRVGRRRSRDVVHRAVWLDGAPAASARRAGTRRQSLDRFLARPDLPLRDRTLWQLL